MSTVNGLPRYGPTCMRNLLFLVVVVCVRGRGYVFKDPVKRSWLSLYNSSSSTVKQKPTVVNK